MKIVSHVIISYNEYLDLFPKIIVQHEGPDQAYLIFPLQPFLRALRVLRGKKMKFEKLSNDVYEIGKYQKGILINFNVTRLKDGIKRFVL